MGAFGVMLNWATHRRDALGRERDLPVLSVSLLVLIAVVAAIPGAQRKMQEHQLGRVASELAGRHVSVHCQDGAEAFVDAGSELGWVRFSADGVPEPRTLIKRAQCLDLKSYLKHRADPSWDEMVAVHVLTHEAMHMPVAKTRMTEELLGAFADAFSPESITPMVTYLCSEACTTTHGAYSAAGGRYSRVFTGIAPGWFAGKGNAVTAEDIAAHIEEIEKQDGYMVPNSTSDEIMALAGLLS